MVAVSLLFIVLAASALADWPDNNTNVAKWIEGPDRSINGFDILAGQGPPGPNGSGNAIILADDFLCTKTGPITDIHLWTSWIGLNASTTLPPIPVTLGIWTDVPATNNPASGQTTPSHPGTLLWSQTLTPGVGLGHYVARPWTSANEQFWDPDPTPQGVILGPDNLIWQYNFYPSNAFVQQGTPNAPVVYWLSMTTGNGQGTSGGPFMGWKTSTNQLLDNAVFGHLDAAGNPLSDWNELISPTSTSANKRSLDLSFVLTTPEIITNPPPPQNKWLQPPNLINGYDVDATGPFVAADDFLCTNASTITNIQVWGSWKGDAVSSNMTFVVSIWSDVPSTVPGGFSHPGSLLWSETFTPGNYLGTFYGNGQEQFLIPPQQVSPETKVYLYNFTPLNPFCQQGSLQSPKVYWLSVYAINPTGAGNGGLFGWKTTTNHWRDDAVYGTVDSFGNAGAWQELFAPVVGSTPVSLGLAFLLNNGPPTPDCDPTVTVKWLQPPDRSTNGLDVLDTAPEILGDDFVCHSPGPISGITVWGSWLNDQVDTNATFQLGLWTDVPAVAGTSSNGYSHPGQLLCATTFYPPQAVGTSLQRYQYTNAIVNVHEKFYNPDLGGTSGFIGADTIIWRYDFYPFQTPGDCWIQRGSPLGPGLTYWVSLSYMPTNSGPYQFGWKTSTTHNMDDAVFGHLAASSGMALGDWKDLRDPRTGQSLDLSFALRNFPVTGINKDIRNTTGQPVTGIQLVVQGFHNITWHYDGVPPWPNFQVSYAGGNTVLQWTGQTIPVNGLTHVGFEMGASAAPNIVSINWLLGNTVLQPPIPQGNFHLLNSGTTLTMVNDIALSPIIISNVIMEFHAAPVGLDQMVGNGSRTPIMTVTPRQPSGSTMPGLGSLVTLPPPPTNALYVMLQINLADSAGNPTTTDFLLMPLDSALLPAIQSVAAQGNTVAAVWTSVPGRTYNIQYTPSLTAPKWTDSGLGDIVADSAQTTSMIPISGNQGFYRVVMLPQ